mgnify:CR=1 FL=1
MWEAQEGSVCVCVQQCVCVCGGNDLQLARVNYNDRSEGIHIDLAQDKSNWILIISWTALTKRYILQSKVAS